MITKFLFFCSRKLPERVERPLLLFFSFFAFFSPGSSAFRQIATLTRIDCQKKRCRTIILLRRTDSDFGVVPTPQKDSHPLSLTAKLKVDKLLPISSG